MAYVDACRFAAVSSGTGDFVVSAAVTGYQTPGSAGVVDGATYYYRAESADLSQWEIGVGTYTVSTNTLARTTVLFNSSGTTSKISFTAAPQVGLVAAAEGLREKLTAARTYYVRTDGSDSNSGLADTAGGAFLTFQHALDIACANLDFGGQTVTITHGSETTKTFTGINTISPWTGGGSLVLSGNSAANTLITSVGNTFTVPNGALPGPVTVQNMKITASANAVNLSSPCSFIIGSGVEFGSCGTSHLQTAVGGGVFTIGANYTISGNTPIHCKALLGEVISISRTITLSGSPVFSTAFAQALECGVIASVGCTFSGATGASSPRYSATLNGVINSFGGGATYFPGDTAGSTATGGQYG